MPRRALDEVVSLLGTTPVRVAALTADLEPAQLRVAPAKGGWSASDVLAHLRGCADVWGGSVVTILAAEKANIHAVNPRTWIEQTDYPQREFEGSLRDFTRQRAELLALLEPLSRPEWARAATVTGAGRVLEWSVLDYAQRLARHERQHCRQVALIVGEIQPRGGQPAR